MLVSGQLFWTSSQNGFLATGPSFTRNSSTMSAGSHTISLLLTGNNFQQHSVQITIWIGPLPTATPTNTPVPPTNTPTRTNTPVRPTNTPTRTNTPVPPTNTPTRTNTPVPPTNTPAKTNTAVPPTKTKAPATDPTATRTSTPSPSPSRESSPTATPAHERPCADFNGDGRVGWSDLALIVRAIEHHTTDLKFDVNRNGRVGWGDAWETIRQLGRRCHTAAPGAH